AGMLVCWTAYLLFFQIESKENKSDEAHAMTQTKVLPGSNKARIVFEDCTYQEVGEGASGSLMEGQFFRLGVDGVSYHEQTAKATAVKPMHTLITPIGGEYSIRLSDGTKVWLNADSKLKYTVSFDGEKNREIELEGEDYFEDVKVKVKNKNVPFVIKSKGVTLELLGTEFNLYTFRNQVITTLVEGSLRLSMDY